MPVIPSNYRLVSGQRASLETVPPPLDRQSLGGQSELISWWFVLDHIHGTTSSTPMSRYNRSALAVTKLFSFQERNFIFEFNQYENFKKNFETFDDESGSGKRDQLKVHSYSGMCPLICQNNSFNSLSSIHILKFQ